MIPPNDFPSRGSDPCYVAPSEKVQLFYLFFYLGSPFFSLYGGVGRCRPEGDANERGSVLALKLAQSRRPLVCDLYGNTARVLLRVLSDLLGRVQLATQQQAAYYGPAG